MSWKKQKGFLLRCTQKRQIKLSPRTLQAILLPDGSLQLAGIGFWACLADDMGLGKTVQVLAFLNTLAGGNWTKNILSTSLLIIPASLLANREQEIKNFFPDFEGVLCPSIYA